MAPLSGTPTDPARRAALLDIKLRALVRDHLGRDVIDVDERNGTSATEGASFGRGAVMIVDGTAWILVDEQPQRGLGAALAWISRRAQHPDASKITQVALIVDSASGVLARRAELFSTPIAVWHAVERLLVPAVAEPHPPAVELDPAHEALRSLIVEGGADPLTESGVLVGEVRGLEVCRAVTDRYTGEVRLEVGVGAHDREAFLMLHGARPTVEALAGVVDAVLEHRRIGAPLHPLNRFGAERFLRWLAVQRADRVGAVALHPVDPPVARTNIKDPVPCVALGETTGGDPLVVVCSTGVDLDLVPFAADARSMHSPEAELVVVVPPRDLNPITLAIARTTTLPTRVVAWT